MEVKNTPVVIAAILLATLMVVVITIFLRVFDVLGGVAAKLGIYGFADVPLSFAKILVPLFILAVTAIIFIAALSTIEEEE